MRAVLFLLALALPAFAQDKPTAPQKKPAASQPAKRPAGKQAQAAHKKPTPEQIRKFNQLEEKEGAQPKKK
ncbi:MAG TPA: hypothetical protein VEU32_19335 [Burkholderiales bacterium]|nr:hypothetical protein [Burkholderiales bacterium]